jgi:hypothetical protein
VPRAFLSSNHIKLCKLNVVRMGEHMEFKQNFSGRPLGRERKGNGKITLRCKLGRFIVKV